MNNRVGFQIGEDFAHYGRSLPEAMPDSVATGYRSGLVEKGKWKSDRFIRKWLQLRLNAFMRDKVFSDQITPDYIKSIDTQMCPITGLELTHATGKDSDWSIDRVSNDFGYLPSNLLVMSVRANQAKGDKSAQEIIKIAMNLKSEREGLTAYEWHRLAELMQWVIYRQMTDQQRSQIGSEKLILDSLLKGEAPIPNTYYSQLAVFQIFLVSQLDSGKDKLADVDKVLNSDKHSTRAFHKLWHRMIKRKVKYLPQEQYRQWENKTTLVLYVEWALKHNLDHIAHFLHDYAGCNYAEPLKSIQKKVEKTYL